MPPVLDVVELSLGRAQVRRRGAALSNQRIIISKRIVWMVNTLLGLVLRFGHNRELVTAL